MVVDRSPHGDFHYTVVTRRRTRVERVHEFASETERFQPGDVVRLDGRFWLIADFEETKPRVVTDPARYRLRLRHPDGREEVGGLRRYRPDAPRLGHSFTTLEDRQPVAGRSSTLVSGETSRAPSSRSRRSGTSPRSRSFRTTRSSSTRSPPEPGRQLPESARAAFDRAERSGLSIELVALEPGEESDWEEAERFIDALVIEEINDDLLELCGVNPDTDPKDGWLETVRNRLRDDLTSFREDIEGEHEQIEQWSFRDGRIFASIGSEDGESDPLSGHGWLCRLVDADVHGAAGFVRVREAASSRLEPTRHGEAALGRSDQPVRQGVEDSSERVWRLSFPHHVGAMCAGARC